ncbi:lysophospholipid acyltransferase family protein [Nakamurella endophytica]|uniref:Phospholipid/glycerol acyltransferase domain-containing protein n=1 Tax=Nakamurella endophytica TaxID=1748367 RepID=A0A917WM10_9ACTN|nr:lysophospholipid acyltransferase family protein [Nakamurella endophytica]GGM13334.1 hypothetical protein GCM10011594_36560 [Nakamurella endophytica]
MRPRVPYQLRRFGRLEALADPTPSHTGRKGMDRGRRIGIVLAAVMYRLRIAGTDRVPATGPVLFVANHMNFFDGPVLFGALPRRVSFLIKAEAVTGPLGWLLRNVGQYSIDRDAPSRDVLMAALAQLKAGGAIGLFPEGTRGDGNVASVFSGAGWLAARAGAQVVPVAVRGTARPAGRGRRLRPVVRVLVGTPVAVPVGAGRAAVQAATDLVREHLAALVVELDSRTAAGSFEQGRIVA